MKDVKHVLDLELVLIIIVKCVNKIVMEHLYITLFMEKKDNVFLNQKNQKIIILMMIILINHVMKDVLLVMELVMMIILIVLNVLNQVQVTYITSYIL